MLSLRTWLLNLAKRRRYKNFLKYGVRALLLVVIRRKNKERRRGAA